MQVPKITRAPRPLPKWAWVLAVLFFPVGMFVAYGSARLLSWWRSVVLAVLSQACIIGFGQAMIQLEHRNSSEVARAALLSGGVLMLSAWGFALYRIGQSAAYWSPAVQRGWRRAGWFALAVFLLSLVTLLLQAAVLWLSQS